MPPGEFLSELETALEEHRFKEVNGMIGELDPAAFTGPQVGRTLNLIRRKRLFPELERAALLFIATGKDAPAVRRHLAQALLDQNRISQGLVVLQTLLPSVEKDPVEGPEVRGLIGRAYKQRFVAEGSREDLTRAIAEYRTGWLADPASNRWHGINFVALLKRAGREGIDPGVSEDADGAARAILSDIDLLDEPGYWDYGTAMEAAVALGDKAAALRWAKKYAAHPHNDRFAVGSTLRQMKEIWQLERTDLGDSLLPVLQYELLHSEEENLEVLNAKPNAEGFQFVYGAEGIVRLEWIETMFERCRAIARVFDSETKEKVGTGFLVRGSDLRPGWGEVPVFVTNSHVVSENQADKAPLRPEDASAEFTRLDGRPVRKLGRLLYSSPRLDLDVSVLEIAAPGGAAPLKPSVYAPALPGKEETQRIFVVGHPEGGELAVSLYDNNLAEYDGRYVRYRSPTDGGSSGSPVFSRRWQPFAVHHRTREEKKLNEGVLFEAIKAATSQSP